MSAWIEIGILGETGKAIGVALLVSAWIEISIIRPAKSLECVALLVSAWIEIPSVSIKTLVAIDCCTPRECMD